MFTINLLAGRAKVPVLHTDPPPTRRTLGRWFEDTFLDTLDGVSDSWLRDHSRRTGQEGDTL